MKVFETSDCDWWLAESPEQARESAIATFGDDDCVYPVEDIRELTSEELARLQYIDEEEGTSRTFLAELERRIARGVNSPEIFASTEY